MTAVKTAKTYALEELKEKAMLALNVPALVEIAKTAPNHTQARDKAYQHVVEQTGDLKDAKKLADSTRFLAMLRRDFTEEFEKLISERKTNILNGNNKIDEPEYTAVQDKKFFLPPEAEVIMSLFKKRDFSTRPDIEIKFWGSSAISFCNELLSALLKDSFSQPLYQHEPAPRDIYELKKLIIKLLEEKFGLKVKVCGNCKYLGNYGKKVIVGHPAFDRLGWECNYSGSTWVRDEFVTCGNWTPKEISRKEN